MRDNKLNFRPSGVGRALFADFAIAGAVGAAEYGRPSLFAAGLLIGAYFLLAIQVADQWERTAVLRLGRFAGMRGPGAFHIIPIVETVSRYVDQRVRVSSVSAESTLTRDTVPTNVDAIVFWL